MTEKEIVELSPALREHLRCFQDHLGGRKIQEHISTYCRGLLADLPRKSVEPIALAAGECVRSLQLLLTHHDWDEAGLRDAMQRHVVQRHLSAPPGEGIGVVGWIDETSVAKKGQKTPGVQRQYCGATGKLENCVVTVHLAVGHGSFTCLLDSDLYVPESWLEDKVRCKEAGIDPDQPFATKCQIALQQVRRALDNGVGFDWMGFDEGYGGKPAFLLGLERMGVRFIGEVPRTFRCFSAGSTAAKASRACDMADCGKAFKGRRGKAFTIVHKTIGDSTWVAKAGRVRVSVEGKRHDREYWLIVARNRQTGELKYFISSASRRVPLKRMLEAAFSRWGIEHVFRVAKSEIGLDHYEGRRYRGLKRHMMLCQLVLLFVAEQTERLRGGKSAGDQGAGGACVERSLPALAAASKR